MQTCGPQFQDILLQSRSSKEAKNSDLKPVLITAMVWRCSFLLRIRMGECTCTPPPPSCTCLRGQAPAVLVFYPWEPGQQVRCATRTHARHAAINQTFIKMRRETAFLSAAADCRQFIRVSSDSRSLLLRTDPGLLLWRTMGHRLNSCYERVTRNSVRRNANETRETFQFSPLGELEHTAE